MDNSSLIHAGPDVCPVLRDSSVKVSPSLSQALVLKVDIANQVDSTNYVRLEHISLLSSKLLKIHVFSVSLGKNASLKDLL